LVIVLNNNLGYICLNFELKAVTNMSQLTVKGLPPRQAEALLCTARGMTHKEAARAMGCSPQNVNMLMDSVRFKLHAKTAAEAVSKAWQSGIIRLMSWVLVVATVNALLPAPAAMATDDDTLIRRIRTRPTGRFVRRIRGSEQIDEFFSDLANQDFADVLCLQPTLVWDEGLYLTYH